MALVRLDWGGKSPQVTIDEDVADRLEEKFLIHRSAILANKTCPYKSFLEYWYEDHGLSPYRLEQHLFIGICVHRALQHLFEHCRVHHPSNDFDEKCIDDAVAWGHQVYREILEKRELKLKYGEDLQYTLREIYNLIEALVRVYAAYRLAEFLEEYEILEVEKEEVFDSLSQIVTWLAKADGLLRRRSDNQLVALSIKTASVFTETNMRNILIDMQGVSEIEAIEDRLNTIRRGLLDGTVAIESLRGSSLGVYLFRLWSKGRETPTINTPIKIFAVQYEYLIKGAHRKVDKTSSHYQYATHLLHPVKTVGYVNLTSSTKSGLQFQTTQSEYEWVIPTGKLPSGKSKVDIYDGIGVKEWISMLASLDVQPQHGNPFKDVIIAGNERLVKRTDIQRREWRVSTKFKAEEIAKHLVEIAFIKKTLDYHLTRKYPDDTLVNDLLKQYEEKIMQYFPKDGKDKQVCYNYYGDECPFTKVCLHNLNIKDAIASGMFITREPHHELEKQQFVQKGFLKEDV